MTPGEPKNEKNDPQGGQNGAKGPQKWAIRSQKVAQREPKGTKREPKGAKWEPKGAKGSQKEPKRSQRSNKRKPKGDQNASQNGFPEKVAKKGGRTDYPPDHFGTFFASKIDIKINAKIYAEKVMKIDEKMMRKLCDFSIKNHRKLIECEKCLMQKNT